MNFADLDALQDVVALRAVGKSLLAKVVSHEQELHARQTQIDALLMELRILKRWRYGARSEQLPHAQRQLFEESLDEDIQALEQALEAVQDESQNPQPQPRARSGTGVPPKREALPAHLPRIEHRYELEHCTCGQCAEALTVIGEAVSEQLDCEPIRFFVHRHIRPQYACRACETVRSAPLPAQVIDKGIAAPGLIAQVLIAKYQDHQPLYRQEEIYARSGVNLPRSTQSALVGAAGFTLSPLVAAMHEHARGQQVLHADETPVAVLAPGEGKTHRAYLWAYRSGPSEAQPVVVFDFQMSRAGRHAQAFLSGFKGGLMVDDFAGYKCLFGPEGCTELACLAHVRRKFFELFVANKSRVAEQALDTIRQLYEIEKQGQPLSVADRQALRQTQAQPILDAFFEWLTETRRKVPDSSGTAKAIDYTLKRWTAIQRYVADGAYPIDNNAVENVIRPIALGRKNWLFAGTELAGKRAANIMSLIASAKINGHDPFHYLKDVLTRLPTLPNSRLHELLPFNWQPA